MSAPMEPLLEISGLSVDYFSGRERVTAVDNVSLTLAPGELLGIVGESGSGKSTIARAILGTLPGSARVTAGTVTHLGVTVVSGDDGGSRRSKRGAGIGFVPQNPFGALNPILTLEKQFRNVMRAHHPRCSRAEVRDRAVAAMINVGLKDARALLRARPHELSGGMKQRVVVALATWLDPMLVVADEPTTGLDLLNQRLVMDLLRAGAVEKQRGLLLVTHDLPMAAEYCDRLLVMRAGKRVETGPVSAVIGNPEHSYTSQLIHSVAMLEKGPVDEALPS